MPYILALDQGTTSSRAILFDHAGGIAAVAQKVTQRGPNQKILHLVRMARVLRVAYATSMELYGKQSSAAMLRKRATWTEIKLQH